MKVTVISRDGVNETTYYSGYYNAVQWVEEGKVGLEIWVDHDKKVSPFYPILSALALLGPGDLHASGVVTGYFVNLGDSARTISDFRVYHERSGEIIDVEPVIELEARSVNTVLPGTIPIANYGTSVELEAKFSIDGAEQRIPLVVRRLTSSELPHVRGSMPWFQPPYFPFDPPLSTDF